MRRFNSAAIAMPFLVLLALTSLTGAQYWFQSGAAADFRSAQNYGGSAQIQTITPQNVVYGSLAYWVGEPLANGAFIQVGYEVPNETGYESASCDINGCSGSVLLNASQPAWFWEYFPAGTSSTNFYGGTGGDGQLGVNGTFNTYSFNSTGDTWNIYLNGVNIGSVDLGTSSSGTNPVVAEAEYAGTNSNNYTMPVVMFKNLDFYNGKSYKQVPTAYSTVGYGNGSETNKPNQYGVKEVNSIIDYFEVGSGIPVQQSAPLWGFGYNLTINSAYGDINSTLSHTAYSSVELYAPQYAAISPGKRAVFSGWTGTGQGSYTGAQRDAMVQINGNIIEQAQWNIQYYVTAASPYGIAGGGGWVLANGIANISIDVQRVTLGTGKRAVFSGWSSGVSNSGFSIPVHGPINITAEWVIQYLVNATTPYGNVTGNGWYNTNSLATLTLDKLFTNQTNYERTAFERWSNGATQSSISVNVTAPVLLVAQYTNQYIVILRAVDDYGNPINASNFSVDENAIPGIFFAFPDKNYTVDHAYYKGVVLSADLPISNVNAPITEDVKLPVYNITIGAQGVMGVPLNATLNITFKNNTQITTRFGPSGKIKFDDVPDGYAYGYEEFLGERRTVTISGGGTVNTSFITPFILVATFIALFLIFFTERFYFIRKERQMQKRRGGVYTNRV